MYLKSARITFAYKFYTFNSDWEVFKANYQKSEPKGTASGL